MVTQYKRENNVFCDKTLRYRSPVSSINASRTPFIILVSQILISYLTNPDAVKYKIEKSIPSFNAHFQELLLQHLRNFSKGSFQKTGGQFRVRVRVSNKKLSNQQENCKH